jgi:hypothetical protein
MPEAIAAFLEPMVDCIVPCAVATIASLAMGLFPYGNLCGEGYPIVALTIVPLLARVSVNADIEMFRFAFGNLRGLCEVRSGAAPAHAPGRSGGCGRPVRGAWAYPGRGVVAGGGHEGTGRAPENAGAKMLCGIPLRQGGAAWRSMDSA